MLRDEERHAHQHHALADNEVRVARIVAARYKRLKEMRVRAPRRDALRGARSHYTSLYYAWRSHVGSTHGARIGTFISLDDLKTLHERLHKEEEQCQP